MVRRSRTEIWAVEGSRSWETMWWPKKPQPPITRTEVEILVGVCVVDMVLMFLENNWCVDDWRSEVEGEVGAQQIARWC